MPSKKLQRLMKRSPDSSVLRRLLMTISSAALVMALSACGSQKANLQPVSNQQEQYPSPAAWMLEPPSNSVQKLDSIFSISDPAS